jgi:type IV pilus assembly protein PilV
MKPSLPITPPQHQRGVALLEVLIVFFVLSIGLLGMAALQLRSIQYNQSSYLRSQATVAAYDMLDRVRLNGGNEILVGNPERDDWVTFVQGVLPTEGAVPTLVCNPPMCTVTIQWEDRFDDDNDDDLTQTLTITSQVN